MEITDHSRLSIRAFLRRTKCGPVHCNSAYRFIFFFSFLFLRFSFIVSLAFFLLSRLLLSFFPFSGILTIPY